MLSPLVEPLGFFKGFPLLYIGTLRIYETTGKPCCCEGCVANELPSSNSIVLQEIPSLAQTTWAIPRSGEICGVVSTCEEG